MRILKTKTELVSVLEGYRKQNKSIGFVPTMGALHQGHISLIHTCIRETDISVCSIFVNPTQFNDPADLDRYPRMPAADTAMLQAAGCHILFLPEVSEIYPEKDTRAFNFGHLDNVLDGAHRPGHFNGVAQVVSRLFDVVRPDKAFFGLKDYQQVLIIKELVRQNNLPVEIVACPILREADGLAMSSRNMLLNEKERKAAALIPKVMNEAKRLREQGKTVEELKAFVEKSFSTDPIYKLDYFEICDSENLKSIDRFSDHIKPIALIACFVGKIRLIDNLFL
jgi:pantoate--beta-alanine ligase